MNGNFDNTKKEDRNLVAKLRNTVSDLNFYCYRFLVRAGYESSSRTGIADAERLIVKAEPIPPQVREILNRYYVILEESEPKNANDYFYETWIFLHEYDKLFKDGI